PVSPRAPRFGCSKRSSSSRRWREAAASRPRRRARARWCRAARRFASRSSRAADRGAPARYRLDERGFFVLDEGPDPGIMTPMPNRTLSIAACAALFVAPMAMAQTGSTPEAGPDEAVELFSLEAKLKESITVASHVAQTEAEAPAVLTVITRS